MSDELLRRCRHRAYVLRQDSQGHDAKLIEDLCAELERAVRDAAELRGALANSALPSVLGHSIRVLPERDSAG